MQPHHPAPGLTPSPNFEFLKAHDQQLVRLGTLAEVNFRTDPNTSLFKLRQFGEVLAQLTGAKSGLFTSPDEPQSDLLRRLKFERIVPLQIVDLFHQIRTVGNRAAHTDSGTHAEALTNLKISRELGVWFHRTFSNAKFSPGPFVPPPDPAAATKSLHDELDRLRKLLDETRTDAERVRIAAEAEARERMSAQEQARKEREERAIWEQLANEAEAAKAALDAQLTLLQAAAAAAPPQATAAIVEKAADAAAELNIDEATTRAIIDEQLRTRGWDASTQDLRYANGARPTKGRNMAIAEWPTESGPADYALFIGTKCIAVVEAKRRNRNVSSHIDQAQRYAQGLKFKGGVESIGGPYPGSGTVPYVVPFVFSSNARRYLKQIETLSGIWFRDTRKPSNLRRALADWPTPDGLKAMLDIDTDASEADLKSRPIEFGFPLRPYQKRAIEKVEEKLAEGRRTMLLAMATGTGKTKLAIALLYRLLAAKRFNRVCFIVDRNALGTQAAGEFSTTRIVSAKTFADIFGLKGLDTIKPDAETKVHICTIQGLVNRVLFTDDPASIPVDQYDLMIVDECRRGYLLDREMSDAELSFRSQDDYVSKYRQVLEHFDAVKIGLTATPALHTADIFGAPIVNYSYRQAVVDGYNNPSALICFLTMGSRIIPSPLTRTVQSRQSVTAPFGTQFTCKNCFNRAIANPASQSQANNGNAANANFVSIAPSRIPDLAAPRARRIELAVDVVQCPEL